ncbi:MAG: hypothetical protein B6I38_06900 [Anaerolineaceae bacterium 4572_5.1]|nr:MAG: hypothetical protein B6I38_06900 [Anaerolineaceae bacterium 4572_5.1]
MREDVLRELAFYVSQTRIGLTQSPPCPPTLGENLLLTPPELGVTNILSNYNITTKRGVP